MAAPPRLRRPGSRGTWGVVASAVAVLVLAGCSTGPVAVDAPQLSAGDESTCRDFVADLPDELNDEDSRETTPADDLNAAWGDPAIVLTCGVGPPAGFVPSSTCVMVGRVGWYVPDDVLLDDDESRDVTMTAVGYRPRVQVLLPGDYRPEGFAAVAATLGAIVDRDLERVSRCG